MLNKKGERELAYVVKVNDITPMDADRLECAHINGWCCVVGKEEFKVGDLAIYFEIDSLLPEKEPFINMEFLKSKHYKIKSQKIRGVVSQGLLMPFSAFGGEVTYMEDGNGKTGVMNGKCYAEGDFLTEELGVTYYVAEDNHRKKVDPDEKYRRMARRHNKLFQTKFFRWMMKRNWGKRLLFVFFGKKKDKPLQFPTHFEYVHKTDEERVENIPWILQDKSPWIKTCKVDGTSATYILERKNFGKSEFYVTSRNVRQLDTNQRNFHNDFGAEGNVYWEMAFKYNIEQFLQSMLDAHKDLTYVCLQGEIAGPSIQKNPHGLKELTLFGFNLIDSKNGRWNTLEACDFCAKYGIKWVPVVDVECILPDTMEEMKLSADGKCDILGSTGLREGFVYRSKDGKKSFKNVSRKYLLGIKD